MQKRIHNYIDFDQAHSSIKPPCLVIQTSSPCQSLSTKSEGTFFLFRIFIGYLVALLCFRLLATFNQVARFETDRVACNALQFSICNLLSYKLIGTGMKNVATFINFFLRTFFGIEIFLQILIWTLQLLSHVGGACKDDHLYVFPYLF